MQITRINLWRGRTVKDPQLLAFGQIVFDDDYVLTDVKLIQNNRGPRFVCLPSRPLMAPCAECDYKNSFMANYCGQCGALVTEQGHEPPIGPNGRPLLRADIFHPLHRDARERLNDPVFREFDRIADRLPTSFQLP
jgi:DNA-binding cell septation regulator SpoVG